MRFSAGSLNETQPVVQAEGFVLAGGRSVRMGRDKALLEIDGAPLIVRALAKLREVGMLPRIAGSRPDLAGFAPVIEDLRPGCGPLGGIEAALSASASELNLFLPVDLPLLPVRLLRWTLARAAMSGAAATIPMLLGRPQPLCCVLRRDSLPAVSGALEAGIFKVVDALTGRDCDLFNVEDIAPTQLGWPFEPPVHCWFQNLNRPEDLHAIRASHERPIADRRSRKTGGKVSWERRSIV